MKKHNKLKKQDGMVLFDNYWIEEGKLDDYLRGRAEAAQKAIDAMESFCENVKLQ